MWEIKILIFTTILYENTKPSIKSKNQIFKDMVKDWS